MKATQAVLQGKDTAIEPALYMSFELGDKAWKLTDRKSTRLNSSHIQKSRMPSSA